MRSYNYLAFDAQYLLVRNFAALKSRTAEPTVKFIDDNPEGFLINTYNFTEHDLVKQFFWSIGKFLRDDFDCNKMILLWDKPPYHKTKLLPDFKGSRPHLTQQDIDEMDINEDPMSYLQAVEDLRVDNLKVKAKYWIIDNLWRLGLPSVICNGWEADDLAILFSRSNSIIRGDMKSAIVSADSDWMYWITKGVDYINYNKKEAWTYNDVELECENKTEELGIDLLTLKTYTDSLFDSHNDLKPVTSLRWKNFSQLYSELQNEDYTNIDDVDRLKLNLESFNVFSYSNYDYAVEKLEEAINLKTPIDISVYFDLKSKGFTVSKSYVENYFESFEIKDYE